MSKYKKTGFGASFKNAFHGLRLLLKSEKNFRVHTIVGFLIFILGIVARFTSVELCILVLTIAIVLLCEMINTAIEFSLDAVFKNRYSKLVGMAKDISAAAVTLSALTSIVIGVILFGRNLFG